MQDYQTFAQKNGVVLQDHGPCQFCGAATTRGVHECLEVFSLSFQSANTTDPSHRFWMVDAHALQHPEIHGRWSNHFHLSRAHLIFHYGFNWTYAHSPLLSEALNQYKASRPDEVLTPPPLLQRGKITSQDVQALAQDFSACRDMIRAWVEATYHAWGENHAVVDQVAQAFLQRI